MTPQIQHRNRIVRVDHAKIIQNALSETHLTADIASGSSTLTVANIEKFSTGDFVWINPFSESSEIIAVHASTSPSGTTITLAANTGTAHQSGEKVYYVEFNQVEIAHASTLTGSKSTLATVALAAGEQETRYLDTSETSGFYFARFRDSVAASTGDYSDGIAYGGWAVNAVGRMIDAALRDVKVKLDEDVTVDDCLRWITEGMEDGQGKLYRWPEHISYNTIVGQAQRGTHVLTMPSDAYDTETNKSIIGVRIGDNKNLEYLDPVTFDNQMEGVKFTQVRTQASANDTSLAVDNSYDFFDSGTLHAYVSGSQDSFTYTGVTRDDATGGTAAFTGIPSSGDDAIGQTITVDTYIWQDEEEGIPQHYTVRNGQLEFWPLVDGTEDDANIYMDYAKVATTVDSEIDAIDFQRHGFLEAYLKWRVWCVKKNSGNLDTTNGYYLQYKERLNDAIRTLPPNNKFRMMPRVNRMMKHGGLNADLQDISIDEQ